MFDAIANNDDRGQVGIGTLIIFIAMVLVAAVAAGVLINTAGLLESQASDTGADSQAQVSNQITVVSAVGNVTGSDTVDYLNFTVMKSAGSDTIDLEDATVEFTSDDASETLTFSASSYSGNGDSFIIADSGSPETALAAGTSTAVLENSSDRVVIGVNLNNIDVLNEGEEATVRLVDQSGATTIYGVNVPDTLTGKNYAAV
ncbi:archaellin/type IV pilin N-terminal domain-containing protein [Haloarchaeobius sp. TZWWS8]|uniref:archaellin/type IV pilin N-terminal domain-containing protein n=1 Tax=Haloarchaeobius sp. TZWWS8 TaxID=3446121 RepID=UPI003EBD5B32